MMAADEADDLTAPSPSDCTSPDYAVGAADVFDDLDVFPAAEMPEWDSDLLTTAVEAVASTSDPVAALAVLMMCLVQDGLVDVEEFERVGVPPSVASEVLAAVRDNSELDDLAFDLSALAAARRLNGQLATIAATLGVEAGTAEMVELRRTVASFALDNDVSDLSIAFRLIKAESPDLLANVLPRTAS
jgi:hypothetical protein